MTPDLSEECQPGRLDPAPLALEWPLESQQSIVQAMCWRGGPTPVVLVHDIGDECELDDWADVLEIMNEYGYTVIAMDLPGHGLSDGAYSERSGAEALDLALRYAKERTGHTAALVMAGRAIGLMRQLPAGPPDIRALVILSPPDGVSVQGVYPRLVFVGATDEDARAAADRFLRESRGWTLVSSFGTSVQGHQLLKSPHGKTIIRQILAFLADYAVPPRR